MKKVYSLIVTLFAVFTALTANAQDQSQISFTLVLDNPDAVTVTISNEEQTVVGGNNEFTVDLYTQLNVKPKENFAITSVTDKDGLDMSLYGGYFSKYFYSVNESGQIYTVTTKNLAESRTCSFTLIADNPELINASLSGSGAVINLVEGSQTVGFDPELETELWLNSIGSKKLYSITVNDEPFEVGWSNAIPLADGMTIDVKGEYPDMPCNITLSFPEGVGMECIKSVAVNYEDITVDGNTFSCQAYDYVSVNVSSAYNVSSYSLNGEVKGSGTYISFTPTEDTELYIDAQPLPKLHATIIVDNPDNVTAMLNYENIELQAGENTIEFVASAASFSVNNSAIGTVTKITQTLNGEETDKTGAYFITLEDGMILNVETTEKDLPNMFVLYVEDVAACDYSFGLSNSDWEEYVVVEGYNFIPFNDGDLALYLGGEAANEHQSVWVNYQLLAPRYAGGSSWLLTPQDGDVVKAFALNPNPDNFQVTFEVEGAEEGDPVTTKDWVTFNDDWKNFTVLGTTAITFGCEADAAVEVYLGEEKIELDKTEYSQNFIYIVTENTTFTVKFGDSGVNSVLLDQAIDSDAVYNLQGIRVGSRANLGSLPRGLYIVGQQKVTVK
ncbi:MAG: hypothetical protein ACI4AM_07385 [Muribaculaceae bacterium]